MLLRLLFVTLATALLLTAFAADARSQTNPTMPSQARDNQKDALYSEFYEHRKMPSADEQRIAYELGKDYLRRYGGQGDDPDVKTVKKIVTEYEKVRGYSQVDAAVRAKHYVAAFEVGRSLLKNDPENFYFLATLSEAGYENALAGDAKLNAETTDYLRRAIQLLEGGKVAKPDPFKNAEVARGFLNFALGWFVKEQSPVEAASAFRKAAQADSPYRTNSEVYYRMGVAIVKGELAQVSAEYNEKFGNKPPSTDQAAMLERINKLADRAIDAYARAVALSTAPEEQDARAKILAQLTALYKNFHNSETGLNELITGVLSKPLP